MTLRALLLLLSVSSLVACGDDRAPGQFPLGKQELSSRAPAAGEATNRRYCVGCHGADGRGNGGTTGADFTGPKSPLRARTDVELATSIREGKRGTTASMPAHGPVLSEAEISAVLAYVRQRFDAPAPTTSSGAVNTGATVGEHPPH
jgi:mono/diheme cytochrome c family protein